MQRRSGLLNRVTSYNDIFTPLPLPPFQLLPHLLLSLPSYPGSLLPAVPENIWRFSIFFSSPGSVVPEACDKFIQVYVVSAARN